MLTAVGKLPDYADWKASVRRDHPRIFFNAETWPAVKAAAEGLAKADLVRLLERCDGYPDTPVCTETDVPKSMKGMTVSFGDTPIPDIREWGDQSAECALARRFTGEPLPQRFFLMIFGSSVSKTETLLSER